MKEGAKCLESDPLGIRMLLVYDGLNDNTAAARSVRELKDYLTAEDVRVIVSESDDDAKAVLITDPTVQCVLLKLNNKDDKDYAKIIELLKALREHNKELPVFLLAGRTAASKVPSEILESVNDFIWVMEDTPDFIAGRVLAATERYRQFILPPMFKALAAFSKVHEYSWHTPGHTGGTGFMHSPAGRAFFNFFREPVFRSDLSISVGELGSLLDHSGPIGESEKYTARVFGADRTYHVTNGSSTSNRVILMASVTRNQVALCDRNCHKSVEHAITLSGAIPTYLIPTRNRYGIIGPITSDRLTSDAVRQTIAENPLVGEGIDPTPVHAIITNSTYDGLCYNVNRVKELLGQSVDRLHFDEAWYGYARAERSAQPRRGDFLHHLRQEQPVFFRQPDAAQHVVQPRLRRRKQQVQRFAAQAAANAHGSQLEAGKRHIQRVHKLCGACRSPVAGQVQLLHRTIPPSWSFRALIDGFSLCFIVPVRIRFVKQCIFLPYFPRGQKNRKSTEIQGFQQDFRRSKSNIFPVRFQALENCK